jgi:hypothetical protein
MQLALCCAHSYVGLCNAVVGTYGVRWDVTDGSFGTVSRWAALGILCVIGMLRIVAPQFLHKSPVDEINNKIIS